MAKIKYQEIFIFIEYDYIVAVYLELVEKHLGIKMKMLIKNIVNRYIF